MPFSLGRAVGTLLLVCGIAGLYGDRLEAKPGYAYERLDMLRDVTPQSARPASISPHWRSLREGMVAHLAEMLALYPDDEIYFLARDGEYFHDLARVLLSDDAATLSRLHLINLSTATATDVNLENYLAQQQISKKGLGKCRAIFLDTGWVGSIPENLRDRLPPDLMKRIVSHFVESSEPLIPGSPVFLEATDPKAATIARTDKINVTEEFEDLPHHTGSAETYELIDGKWIANSVTPGDEAGTKILRRDLKSFGEAAETRSRFQRLWKEMRLLREVATGKQKADPDALKASLERLEKDGVKGFLPDLREAELTGAVKVPAKASATFWKQVPGGAPQVDDEIIAEALRTTDYLKDKPELKQYLNPAVATGSHFEEMVKLSQSNDTPTKVAVLKSGATQQSQYLLTQMANHFHWEKDRPLYEIALQQAQPSTLRWIRDQLLAHPAVVNAPGALDLLKEFTRVPGGRAALDDLPELRTIWKAIPEAAKSLAAPAVAEPSASQWADYLTSRDAKLRADLGKSAAQEPLGKHATPAAKANQVDSAFRQVFENATRARILDQLTRTVELLPAALRIDVLRQLERRDLSVPLKTALQRIELATPETAPKPANSKQWIKFIEKYRERDSWPEGREAEFIAFIKELDGGNRRPVLEALAEHTREPVLRRVTQQLNTLGDAHLQRQLGTIPRCRLLIETLNH